MTVTMVDTTICVAAQRGGERERAFLEGADRVLICPVAVGELLAGVEMASPGGSRRRAQVTRFLRSPRLKVVPISEETARFYAMVKAQLKRCGRPIPPNDMWIAASAMEYGSPLLTHDRHFAYVEGLLLADDLLPED